MASLKVILRALTPNANEGTLLFRIIHGRKMCQIHTGIRISNHEWDKKESRIIISGSTSRQDYLNSANSKLARNIKRLRQIISRFEKSGMEYSSADVAERYFDSCTSTGFISFARKIMAEEKKMGKESAREHCSSAINSLIRFLGKEDLRFCEFDSMLMHSYECHLRKLNLTPNTISFYMRKLRAIYNLAVEKGLTPQRHPFSHVYTGMAKTRKRAVSLEVIRCLRRLDLRNDHASELARDMFLFSFYTRGMSFIDMVYLKKSDLHDGVLSYRRQKTGQQLYIRWEQQMQNIANRYSRPDSDFLLPFITSGGDNARRQYKNASHLINRYLKKLGVRIGMTEPLTMYCARHSWASIAHANDVPLSVISQGMGHDSEKTTRIYLASLDMSEVDNANSRILSLLNN